MPPVTAGGKPKWYKKDLCVQYGRSEVLLYTGEETIALLFKFTFQATGEELLQHAGRIGLFIEDVVHSAADG